MTVEFSNPQSQEQIRLQELATALPRSGPTRTLHPTSAAMFMGYVAESGSNLPDEAYKVIAPLTNESLEHLEAIVDHPDAFVITRDELRGIVARAAHSAAAQTAFALALATREVQQLDILHLDNPPESNSSEAI